MCSSRTDGRRWARARRSPQDRVHAEGPEGVGGSGVSTPATATPDPETHRRAGMARVLQCLLMAMGVTCVAIGAAHFALGIDSVPGEGTASATVDSRERFYGAIFFGYGLAWIAVARRSPIPASLVRWLAAIFLLGGVGRVVSTLVHGRPQWFQIVLAVIEFALPPICWLLADADQHAHDNAPTVRAPDPVRPTNH